VVVFDLIPSSFRATVVEIVGGDNKPTFHSCRDIITVNEKKDLSSVLLACFFRIRLCNFTPTALSRSVTRRCLDLFPQICLVDSIIQCVASKSYECTNMNGTAMSLVYCSRTQRDSWVEFVGGRAESC